MGRDYLSSWVQDGQSFAFNEPYALERFDPGTLRFRIPTAEIAGDGEYQADSTAEPRSVVLSGTLMAADPDELQSRWDTLAGALRRGTAGKLYRHSGRYLKARVETLTEPPDEGLSVFEWIAAFRCADPFYWSETAQSQNLVAGANVVSAGGNVAALPIFTIGTSGAAIITISHGGKSFTLSPTSGGSYIVDCSEGTVLVGGVDAIDKFSGEFIELGTAAGGALTVTVTSGVLASGNVPMAWRSRWQSA